MKVGVLTKNGISFSSKPILIDNPSIFELRLTKEEENPIKKFSILKEKLILSDTGRMKNRLNYFERNRLLKELISIL